MSAFVSGFSRFTGTGSTRGSNFAQSAGSSGAFGGSVQRPPVTNFQTKLQIGEFIYDISADVLTIGQVLFAVFVTCFLVLRILGACCGNALRPFQSIAQWFTWQFDRYDELRKAMDPHSKKSLAKQWMSWALAVVLWCFPLLPARAFAIVFIIFREFCYNCAWLIFLLAGATALLIFESQFSTMVGYVIDSSELATSTAATAASGFNTALDASYAIIPLYNTQAGQSVKYYYGLYQVLHETDSINAGLGLPAPLSGRRLGEVAVDPLGPALRELETGAISLATKQEILSDVSRIVQLIFVAISLEAVTIISAVLPTLALGTSCAGLNFPCFIREYVSDALNVVLTVINAVATFFGAAKVSLPSAFAACTGSDFADGMPCSCASSEGGPYTGLTSCGPATVTCTTNCAAGRRALTMVGALMESEKFTMQGFSRKCFRVDLVTNGTLWEVCPELETKKVAWTLLKDSSGGNRGRRRLSSAAEARDHLASSLGAHVSGDVRVRHRAPTPPTRSASPTATPTTKQKAGSVDLERAIASLERASKVRMASTFITVGKLVISCRDLDSRIEFKSPVALAVSVACVAASLTDGVVGNQAGGGGDAPFTLRSHDDAMEELRENMLVGMRAIFARGTSSGSNKRSLQEQEKENEKEEPARVNPALHAAVRYSANLRARLAVLSAAADRARGPGPAGDVSPHESPMAHAVQVTIRRFRELEERRKKEDEKKRRLSTESASPTAAPTSVIPKVKNGWGVFGTPTQCGEGSKACPGFPSQCYALNAECPYPSGANFLAVGQWGVQYANSQTSGWSPSSLLVDAVTCPNQWFENPQTDPVFHLGDYENPGALCYPQVTPWQSGYATEVDLRLSPYLDAFCSGEQNQGGCECVYYYTDLFDVNIQTLAGISQALQAILFNGGLAFWTYYTTIFYYFLGPWVVNLFWNPTFRALGFPAWFYRLWLDQAQPGPAWHRLTCAGLHTGELFLDLFFFLMLAVVLVKPAVYLFAILAELLQYIECFLLLLVRTVAGGVWSARVFGFENVEGGKRVMEMGSKRFARDLHQRVFGAPPGALKSWRLGSGTKTE